MLQGQLAISRDTSDPVVKTAAFVRPNTAAPAFVARVRTCRCECIRLECIGRCIVLIHPYMDALVTSCFGAMYSTMISHFCFGWLDKSLVSFVFRSTCTSSNYNIRVLTLYFFFKVFLIAHTRRMRCCCCSYYYHQDCSCFLMLLNDGTKRL